MGKLVSMKGFFVGRYQMMAFLQVEMTAFSTTRELKATYNSDNVKKANCRMDRLVTHLSQMSYSKYFEMEIMNTYELNKEHEKYEEKIEKFYTLIRIPLHLEKFFGYGFMLAFDSFIFMLSMLPLRMFLVLRTLFNCLLLSPSTKRVLDAAQVCDVVRFLLTLLCCCSLQTIDLSFLYHQVCVID